ncbi:DNA polymerase [Hafnia phage yong3]|nr:DNA polymerase [Hafnia phage yong3]
MRADAIGFFWEDLPPPPKVKKEKVKRLPPERTWERPDYLPHLEDARAFNFNLYTQEELINACIYQEPLVFDVECYPNYFLCAFRGVTSGKVIYTEMYHGQPLNTLLLNWLMTNFKIVSFNGLGYDQPIITLAIAGCNTAQLYDATKKIIEEDWRPSDVLKSYKLKRMYLNHIDIMEVLPGSGGLKQYGGRGHTKMLQDLPFKPGTFLSPEQMLITRWYCINDLVQTKENYDALSEQIHLREILGEEYGLDLRSRSDAQIAEDVIKHEIKALTGQHPKRPYVEPGTLYNYDIPHFIQFRTPLMQSVLDIVRGCKFVVSDNGSIGLPPALTGLEIKIGKGVYRMGIGGLHSSEECAAHPPKQGQKKRDIDVTSYYPSIILNERLYPEQLGEAFLQVYQRIVDRRIAAKRAGDKKTANTLKIVINGSFGKLGSMWSVLYAPKLLIQVTITGQLSLLMLIEAFELNGIEVISANTDGIVVKYDEEQEGFVDAMIKWWESVTNFEMESTYYAGLYSANVNNYVAVKEPDENGKVEVKRKGWFAETGLQKNCTGEIIMEAVCECLANGTPVSRTIRACTDIRKFVILRAVKGGAVWDGEFLGKVVRWYYSTSEPAEMVYANSGNRVAGSAGGKPIMTLPDELPGDIDYDAYIAKAEKYLEEVGYV